MKGKIQSLKPLLFIFLGAGLTFLACQKEYKTSTVVYDETYCEPWGVDTSGLGTSLIPQEELKDSVNIFLRENDIHVANLELSTAEDSLSRLDTIFTNTSDTMTPVDTFICPACICPTGRRIEATIYTNDTTAIKEFGFSAQ